MEVMGLAKPIGGTVGGGDGRHVSWENLLIDPGLLARVEDGERLCNLSSLSFGSRVELSWRRSIDRRP